MKYLIINPISLIANPAPVIGTPQILGVLENAGIETEFIDLNLKYINRKLSYTGIHEFINYYNHILKITNNIMLNNQFQKIKPKLEISAKNINISKMIMKDKKYFYNFILQYYAKNLICNTCMDLFSMTETLESGIWQVNESGEMNGINNSKLLNYFEEELLDYKKFYEDEIDNILKKLPDILGIEISFRQLFGGLYLCYLIKKKSNIHINIFGNFFNSDYDKIDNLKEFIPFYFDSISIGNNANTPIELAKYTDGKIALKDVPDIIYMNKNKIERNKHNVRYKEIEELPMQSFSGFDGSLYYAPDIVLPVYTSTSCYWRKCIFCACCGTEYKQKSVEKVINEIEYLSKKYNTKYFYFWDNAVSPNFLNKMADKLIEKKLDIKYSIYSRFEKELSLKLLKKARKSGLLMIYFGLDSASDKILQYINKGITTEQAEKVLRNSHKSGIFNALYLILGHPQETIDDLKKDEQFIKKNKKNINVVIASPEVLFLKGSELSKKKEKYKSEIILTEEERMYYYNKIVNEFEFNQSHSVFDLIYLSKKGLKQYNRDVNSFKFILKHNNLFRLYLKHKIKTIDKIQKNNKKY